MLASFHNTFIARFGWRGLSSSSRTASPEGALHTPGLSIAIPPIFALWLPAILSTVMVVGMGSRSALAESFALLLGWAAILVASQIAVRLPGKPFTKSAWFACAQERLVRMLGWLGGLSLLYVGFYGLHDFLTRFWMQSPLESLVTPLASTLAVAVAVIAGWFWHALPAQLGRWQSMGILTETTASEVLWLGTLVFLVSPFEIILQERPIAIEFSAATLYVALRLGCGLHVDRKQMAPRNVASVKAPPTLWIVSQAPLTTRADLRMLNQVCRWYTQGPIALLVARGSQVLGRHALLLDQQRKSSLMFASSELEISDWRRTLPPDHLWRALTYRQLLPGAVDIPSVFETVYGANDRVLLLVRELRDLGQWTFALKPSLTRVLARGDEFIPAQLHGFDMIDAAPEASSRFTGRTWESLQSWLADSVAKQSRRKPVANAGRGHPVRVLVSMVAVAVAGPCHGLFTIDHEEPGLVAIEQELTAREMNQRGLDSFYGRNGTSQSNSEALNWFKRTAELGDADGQANLGYMYESGRGLPKDDVAAVKWYTLAAEQGNAAGQVNLGHMYERGHGGLIKDEVVAVKWYELSADQGNADGQANLGNMYYSGRGGLGKDEVAAVKWYRLAALQGNAAGQVNLGYMYENGLGGLANDEVAAVQWYKRAAEQGDADGQANLGVMYAKGRGGLVKDEVAAVKWFKRSADQGNAYGQVSIGDMHAEGRGGLAKDEVAALKWYELAAGQGNELARLRLQRWID